MVPIASLLFPLMVVIISYATSPVSSLSGRCYMRRTVKGQCQDYLGSTSREDCCSYGGYFIRKDDPGDVFLSTVLIRNNVPRCENACDKDYCADKTCPVGQFCLRRKHGSICTSECTCTAEQKTSGPICVNKGPKFMNMCEYQLNSCWVNKTWLIEACPKTGCENRNCGSNKCILNLQGRSECIDEVDGCIKDNSIPICGVDNVTYSNDCELKKASIQRGVEIRLAYMGICQASATCDSVDCPESRMSCLRHHKSGIPVCVKCPRTMRQCLRKEYWSNEIFCSSNNRQTYNTCVIDYLSCDERSFDEIVSSGMCPRKARLN